MTAVDAGREDRRAGRKLELASAGLALAAGVVALAVIADEPWWTIWLLFVPAAVAAAPLALPAGRARRAGTVAAAAVLVVWCVLAAASVGLFYLPATLTMIAAAIRGRRRRR